MKHPLIKWWNRLRGYGYYWVETPGTPAGGYIEALPGTCPHAIRNDWSANACIKAGDCGCNELEREAGRGGK